MDKVFTSEELAKIKRIVEHLFSPLVGKVEISKRIKASVLYQRLDGPNIETESHSYNVIFKSPEVNVEIIVSYPVNSEVTTAMYGWDVAERIYDRIQTSLGAGRVFVQNRIWPRDNNLQPDYKALDKI